MAESSAALSLHRELTILAMSAAHQVRYASPGCVTCDLISDYKLAKDIFLESLCINLPPDHINALKQVDAALDALKDADCICFDNSVLLRPNWVLVRARAKQALGIFGWKEESLSEFTETAPGVWWRP